MKQAFTCGHLCTRTPYHHILCIQLIKITWQQYFPLFRCLHRFSRRVTNLHLSLSLFLSITHTLSPTSSDNIIVNYHLSFIWTNTVFCCPIVLPLTSHTSHPTDFWSNFIVWGIELAKRGGFRVYNSKVVDYHVCVCVCVSNKIDSPLGYIGGS